MELEELQELIEKVDEVLGKEQGVYAVMVCRHYIDFRTTRDQMKQRQGGGVVGAQAMVPPPHGRM